MPSIWLFSSLAISSQRSARDEVEFRHRVAADIAGPAATPIGGDADHVRARLIGRNGFRDLAGGHAHEQQCAIRLRRHGHDRIAGEQHEAASGQVAHPPGLLGHPDAARAEHGDPGGVVAAVLEPLQAREQEGSCLMMTGVADDSAQGGGLRLGSAVQDAPYAGCPAQP